MFPTHAFEQSHCDALYWTHIYYRFLQKNQERNGDVCMNKSMYVCMYVCIFKYVCTVCIYLSIYVQ